MINLNNLFFTVIARQKGERILAHPVDSEIRHCQQYVWTNIDAWKDSVGTM